MSDAEGLSNPYDPTAQDLSPETPTLGQVMSYALHQHSLRLRVALPCQIVAVHGNQLVDLQPLLMSRYTVSPNTPVALPILTNTLVAMPMGADYGIRFPLAVGDTGYCIFCDRSLDLWASGQGGTVDPLDSRSHDLTDGVFYPGLVPTAGQTQDNTTDLTVANGQAVIKTQKSGTFVISNGTAELVDLVQQLAAQLGSLCDTLSSAGVIGSLGPGTFNPATIANLQAQSAQAKQAAATIKTLVGSP